MCTHLKLRLAAAILLFTQLQIKVVIHAHKPKFVFLKQLFHALLNRNINDISRDWLESVNTLGYML